MSGAQLTKGAERQIDSPLGRQISSIIDSRAMILSDERELAGDLQRANERNIRPPASADFRDKQALARFLSMNESAS